MAMGGTNGTDTSNMWSTIGWYQYIQIYIVVYEQSRTKSRLQVGNYNLNEGWKNPLSDTYGDWQDSWKDIRCYDTAYILNTY